METIINQNQQLKNEIEKIILVSGVKIAKGLIEYTNYLECLKDEKFGELPNETEEEAIKRAESILDRLDEMVKRNDEANKKTHETTEVLNKMSNLFNKILKNMKNERKEFSIKNNELIDVIIELEKRKTNKLSQQNPLKKEEYFKKFRSKQEELNEDRIAIDGLEQIEKERFLKKMNNIINLNEMKQIEKWTKLNFEKVIFDSEIDNWNKNTSVFDERITNQNNLIFLIEDEDNNKFGGYINAKICGENDGISDSKAFVFSLKSNGRLNGMLKFDIKESQYAFCRRNNPKSRGLFSIGYGKDICIYKEKYKNESYCKQSFFNYNRIQNALCGKSQPETFIPKRIKVIRLIDSEQEKRKKFEQSKTEEQEMLLIEIWTQMKIGNIIFDSDIDNWKQNTSVFDQRILNKSNLIFIIEDDDGNKFGGYVNAIINEYGWIDDPKSFLFTVKSNGRLSGMMRFINKESQYAFYLWNQSDNRLFSFGFGKDICIFKENNKNESYCKQTFFNYNRIENALCGKSFPERFKTTRITVIQLI